MNTINTLSNLYTAFDGLYKDITPFCTNCAYACCFGYVWLLPEEAERLYNEGVSVIEINDRINFVHSFPSKNGKVTVDQIKPPCLLCKDGKCTIYSKRPLICRSYPIDLRMKDNILYVVIHNECYFIQTKEFVNKVLAIFESLDQELLKKLYDTYSAVNELSVWPEGAEPKDDNTKILKIQIKKGGEISMSKCKAVLDSKKVKKISVKSKK